MDPTETAGAALDFLAAGLRHARAQGANPDIDLAVDAIETERDHILDLAVDAARGADGKVDPVAITDNVLDATVGVVSAIPAAVPFLGLLNLFAELGRRLGFEASKNSLHGTGDVAVTVDLRRAG